jgi:hypothetical protein
MEWAARKQDFKFMAHVVSLEIYKKSTIDQELGSGLRIVSSITEFLCRVVITYHVCGHVAGKEDSWSC